MDTTKLKVMAEHISSNCASPNVALHRQNIANHLQMFWSPSMRRQLFDAYQRQEVVLDAQLGEALAESIVPHTS